MLNMCVCVCVRVGERERGGRKGGSTGLGECVRSGVCEFKLLVDTQSSNEHFKKKKIYYLILKFKYQYN